MSFQTGKEKIRAVHFSRKNKNGLHNSKVRKNVILSGVYLESVSLLMLSPLPNMHIINKLSLAPLKTTLMC